MTTVAIRPGILATAILLAIPILLTNCGGGTSSDDETSGDGIGVGPNPTVVGGDATDDESSGDDVGLGDDPIDTPDETSLDDLRVGDCVDDSGHGTNEVGEITVVNCGSPHDAEVFAVATLLGEPSAPYPGDNEVNRLSNELCLSEFASYVGIEYQDSVLGYTYFMPTQASWQSNDHRLVVCTLNDPDLNRLEGSKQNSRT